MNIPKLLKLQRDFFATQQTKDISFRKATLKKLLSEVIKRENSIIKALNNDFKKSEYETVMTETSIVISELKMTLKKLDSWAKPKRVTPYLLNFPSSAKIYSEPYGTTLVIAPWNYPYQLAIAPLVGTVAAGNTAVLKPSELTPNTSKVIKEIINAVFKPEHVTAVEGGITISQELLTQRWNYIFFTGSVSVGKIVAKAAAKHLTPVTLELGGKNPCIIDETANIKLAAKRLVWGKCINAGQTCIAPDYWLVHLSVKEKLIDAFKDELVKAYGKTPQKSEDYPRIVNTKNFDRLTSLLKNEKILVGGQTDRKDKYIAPTLVDNPSLDSEIMKGEIFGPISPILTYKEENEIDKIISKYPKPLALYVFSNRKSFAEKIIKRHSFGGGTINDTIVHFANHRLPFGGVGESGIGRYHGKQTFDTFSHKKGVVSRGTWLDITTRYAPYKEKLKQLKMLTKWG